MFYFLNQYINFPYMHLQIEIKCNQHKVKLSWAAAQSDQRMKVLQKVLSLGSDYFSATFYQTFFYYKPSSILPLLKHIFVTFLPSRKKQINSLFWYLLETLINSAAKSTSRCILISRKRFWSFLFHCLLSALLCGSNMCTQVSSPVSKLEITQLLQPLYVSKSSRAHLRRCVFCSSVSLWGTYRAQTSLRSKRFFRMVCTLHSDMPVQLAISLTDSRASCSTTIFTAVMLALVKEVLGLPGQVSSSAENFPGVKALTRLKTAHWNCLRSIYTTQFIKYLLWIYIKPNEAFNIAMNFSLLVHVPM